MLQTVEEKPAIKLVPYSNVPAKAVFKVLKTEYYPATAYRKGVLVPNSGIYVKVADSHSVDVATKRDCIFSPDTPCRVVSKHAERFQ